MKYPQLSFMIVEDIIYILVEYLGLYDEIY